MAESAKGPYDRTIFYVSDGTPSDTCTTIGTGNDIPNCVFYSPTGCAVCEGGFYLDTSLQRISQCVPLPVTFTNILNCQYYILQGTTIACQYCEFTYYLQTVSGAQQCTALPAYIVANCESYDKQVCVKCIDGYFFNAATNTCDPDSACENLDIVQGILADVRRDAVLAAHAVDQHLEVQLAHAGDLGLAGLLVGLDLERRVLLSEATECDRHLFLV